jgi:hypothetical protein
MDLLVPKLQKITFTEEDIRRVCQGKVNVLGYPELGSEEYPDLDSVLGQYGAAVILYETKDNFGHWVALLRCNSKREEKEPTLEWFDR